MNRYRCLRTSLREYGGIGELLTAAEAAAKGGQRGAVTVYGIVAAGQVAAGSTELLGVLEITADGVGLREIEPAEAGTD